MSKLQTIYAPKKKLFCKVCSCCTALAAVWALSLSSVLGLVVKLKTLSGIHSSIINIKQSGSLQWSEASQPGPWSTLWHQLPRHCNASCTAPSCTAQALAHCNSRGGRHAPIEWLHLPKTGTSFGNTLILWACPELNSSKLWMGRAGPKAPSDCLFNFKAHEVHMAGLPFGDHHSLTGRSEEELGRVVTMLRYPPARLAWGTTTSS